jgi:transposase InsO family protein
MIEHLATKADARARIEVWIEEDNTIRRHSALDMRSPISL